jgi:hypothetical protein
VASSGVFGALETAKDLSVLAIALLQFKVKSRINRQGRPAPLQAVPVCSPG